MPTPPAASWLDRTLPERMQPPGPVRPVLIVELLDTAVETTRASR